MTTPATIAIDARKLNDFGIGTYVRHLVDHLRRLDSEHNVLLLVRPGDEGSFGELSDNFATVAEPAAVYSVRELFSVSWRLFRSGVDLYHATHYVLPLWLPNRTIVTIHDIIHLLFPEFLPNRFAALYARSMIRRGLQQADAVIAVSNSTRRDLMEHFQLPKARLEVIHNGVDAIYRNRLPRAELDARLAELGLSDPYLLFVGNPKPHKNLDNVIKAYARAVERQPETPDLVCVGARPGSDFKARMRAEQLGVGDRVRQLGHVPSEALPAIYQGATLFLYPTLYEGFGLPVLEAMASGVAVITSNNSALAEIASGAAHLVSPLDVDDIASAMLRCLRDDEYRASLAAAGVERAQEFRWRQTAERTLDLYRRVLARR